MEEDTISVSVERETSNARTPSTLPLSVLSARAMDMMRVFVCKSTYGSVNIVFSDAMASLYQGLVLES